MQHDIEKSLFDKKWTDYENKGHIEVYREQGEEESLKKRASEDGNFTAKTVLFNAAKTILGVQAVGGAAGAAGGAASVAIGVDVVASAVASLGGKRIIIDCFSFTVS